VTAGGLFWLFFVASLLTFGGFGGLPIVHQELVESGSLSDAQFAHALAVGLTAPGPNGLYIISLGYLLGGIPGALAATFAVALPPFTILPVASAYDRFAHRPRVRSALRHLGLAVAGLVMVALWSILRGTVGGLADAGIAFGAFLLATRTRVHVTVPLGLAALAGVLVHR
jgi:chromate transporter